MICMKFSKLIYNIFLKSNFLASADIKAFGYICLFGMLPCTFYTQGVFVFFVQKSVNQMLTISTYTDGSYNKQASSQMKLW